MIRLENWSVCFGSADPWRPPEGCASTLQGNVYGHPLHDDGKFVVTSVPVTIDKEKRQIKTYSGSVYVLGEPDKEWIAWLEEQGHPRADDPFPVWRNLEWAEEKD